MSLDLMQKICKASCHCGKEHSFSSKIVIGEGVIGKLPDIVGELGAKKVFVIADERTYAAAGEDVCEILKTSGISVSSYIFHGEHIEPDETNVGLAVMHYDYESDAVIGVGSGVINDISKIVAAVADKPYIIVGTAPSMDGYASASSSMTRAGLKISLPSKCADVIVGDLNILCEAPMKLMVSGLGDMLAKYVSICEWRIAALVTGEYYCEEIASLVRAALKRCTDNAEGLLRRDKEAVAAVFEGLVICGAAMKLAGVSRPASGIEHYLSHIWDMRGAEFGTSVELHGLQCALGTLIAARLYEKLVTMTPDKEKALSAVSQFDYAQWSKTLRDFLGKGAESMIELEAKEGKYELESHKTRLEKIISNWDTIIEIIKEEVPSSAQIEALLDRLGSPKTMSEIGIDESILPTTFKATKDIRDKYVLSRLCWDLGVTDELLEEK